MSAVGAAFAVVLALLVPAAIAVAQETPEAPAPTTPAPPAELPVVPVPRIAEASEDLTRTLRGLTTGLQPQRAVQTLEQELPEAQTRGREMRAEADTLLADAPSLEALADTERRWQDRVQVFASQREILTRRAALLEDDLAVLDGLEDAWVRTLDAARGAAAPAEVLAACRRNLASIGEVRERVTARRAEILGLLNSVSREELGASELLQELSEARTNVRARLFEPDRAPLWSPARSADGAGGWQQVGAHVAAGWDDLVRFGAERWRQVVLMALGFVLALVLARRLRTRIRRRLRAEERPEGAILVFERPVSVALLVTALVGGSVFRLAPQIVLELFGAVLIIPALRLLIPVVASGFHPLLFTLGGLYLVDRLRDVIASVPELERGVFFFETLLATALLVVLLRPARLASFPPGVSAPAFLGAALRGALVLLALATAANGFGYVAFSRVLGDGTLSSAYLAVVLYAAYRVVTTVLLVLLAKGPASRVGIVRSSAPQLLAWGRWTALVLAGTGWILGTLDAFSVRDTALDALGGALLTPLTLGTLSISLSDVLVFGLTIALAFGLSRALRVLLRDDVFPRLPLRRGVANATSTTLHYTILLSGFFLAVGAAGIDMSRFTLLAGAFGVGIGFGLQNVVNNFASGLILLYERPIQVGDNIEVGGILGEVRAIGIRSSVIRTFQGAEVIVPNGNLVSGELTNWTLSDMHRRIDLPVGVAYGNRPADVIAVLMRVLTSEARVLSHPAPNVLFRGFGNSSLDFEMRFWVANYLTYVQLASDVASAAYDALNEAGIEIPFPQTDLHLKSVAPAAAAGLAGESGDEDEKG